VTFRLRHSATKSAVSYALSHPTVTCFVPGICSNITSAASRSAVPLASNTSVFTIKPLRFSARRFPVVTHLGFFALAFARQLRVPIRLRFVRLVRPLLPVEIHGRVAMIGWQSLGLAILSLKTLHTRPCFEQRSVNREVAVREQIPLTCLLEHSLEEGARNVPIEQAFAVLGEHGCVPDRIIHVQAHEPSENTNLIRRSIESGEVREPRILTVGEPFWGKGGTPIYIKGFLETNHIVIPEVESTAQAAGRVRQEIRDGADGIKIFANSIEADGILTMPLDLAKAIVAEAHRAGKPVFAHISNDHGIEIAVQSGVDILAHTTPIGELWSPSFAKRLTAAHMALTPTLTLWDFEGKRGNAPPEKSRKG